MKQTCLSCMKEKLVFFISTLILAATMPAKAQKTSAGRKLPNIIYIYADDLGYGELGCYGQEKIKTPHLDRMAQEGIRFTRHYSAAPVCAPSRNSLLTGRHTGHGYIRGNYELGGFADSLEGGQMPLHEGAVTIPKLLKERGYTTGLVGKWGLGVTGTTGNPHNQGFDYYFSVLDQKQAHNYYPTHLWENNERIALENKEFMVHRSLDPRTAKESDFEEFKGKEYAPEKFSVKAMDFIEKNRDNPFFLYLSYTLPHLALQAPDSYVLRYKGQFEERPYYGEEKYCPSLFPLSTYAAMITFLDDQVGRIMEKVKSLGLDENTLIMFSSDNGPTPSLSFITRFFNSTGGLNGRKMEVYEGGIRVPFLARWPKQIEAQTVSDHVSVQYDLLPTMAEITGAPVKNTDGISFLPALLGKNEKQPQHDFLYFEYPENGGQVAVRLGNWKAVRRNMKSKVKGPWELYDLVNDPLEQKNLAAENPDIIEKVQVIIKREHTHPHIQEWEILDSKMGNR